MSISANSRHLLRLPLCGALVLVAACGEDPGSGDSGTGDPSEVITTVTLGLIAADGQLVSATFDDPDGDGGAAPTVDSLVLVAGTTYAVTVRFQNRLEDPPAEITDEIRAEAEDHQIFFTGNAVTGPASDVPGAPLTHAYADADANGLPIGLGSSFATTIGFGELIVTLRHLPPLNGVATKTADLAGQVRAGGFAAIPGSTDAQVTFPVTALNE